MKTNSQLSTIFTVAFSCFHFSNTCNYVGDENKIINQEKNLHFPVFKVLEKEEENTEHEIFIFLLLLLLLSLLLFARQ